MSSYWIDSTKENSFNFENLNDDTECDICIIGGGITGISTAYELSMLGYKVIVVDRNNIATHTTGNTTAKITSQHDLFYKYLTDSFSKNIAKKYLFANEEAISNIQSMVLSENIDCDFEIIDNYLFTQDETSIQKIKDETTCINSLGITAEFVETTPLPLNILGAIKLNNQAQFHPRKYVLGLCNSIFKNNGKIYINTIVYDIKKHGDKYVTYTKNNKVTSKYVVIASHYPIINFPGFYFLKMYQEKSYIVAVDANTELFDGMYINTELPTLSFRTAKYNDKRILLIGGSGHKVGINNNVEDSYKFLEQTAKSMYPNSKILYRWSTQDCISLDKLPYIGEFSTLMPNVYVATGFKKWGMTTSNIASNIIKSKILGEENIYSEVFTSTRFKPFKNHKEMKNMIKQTTKSLVIDKLEFPKINVNDLNEDEGKIIEVNGKKFGAYKKEGKIYYINPICSHLGCELKFNNLEKTWDCPCHGSRFDYTGKSINEPSINDL